MFIIGAYNSIDNCQSLNTPYIPVHITYDGTLFNAKVKIGKLIKKHFIAKSLSAP